MQSKVIGIFIVLNGFFAIFNHSWFNAVIAILLYVIYIALKNQEENEKLIAIREETERQQKLKDIKGNRE
jgi:type IV secretory pathway VirB3-like protein